MNKEFKSNQELFEAIKKLQNSLIVSGNEKAANKISEGISCLNGLTDGWALLMEVLEDVKKEYGYKFNKSQEQNIGDIYSCVRKVVYRHS